MVVWFSAQSFVLDLEPKLRTVQVQRKRGRNFSEQFEPRSLFISAVDAMKKALKAFP